MYFRKLREGIFPRARARALRNARLFCKVVALERTPIDLGTRIDLCNDQAGGPRCLDINERDGGGGEARINSLLARSEIDRKIRR